MKKTIFTGFVMLTALFSYCQITIVRSDVFDLGDEIPRIYYAYEQESESCHVDSIIDDPVVFDDFVFPFVDIDTLIYQDPSESDLNGLYEGATCSYMTRDGYVMHLGIADDAIKLVGIQGELPMTGDPMNLVFVDTLILGTYPFNFEDNHSDIGTAIEKQHISAFESIIPEEYYSTVSGLYDTVLFVMDLNVNVNYDEFGDMQFVGDSNLNGTFSYLRENGRLRTRTDVKLRSKFSGVYTPLADIPGIGDQLPMELPILDTTCTYKYWTKDMKSPLAEIELNTAYDMVYSATFRYAYLSSVPEFTKLNHNVYPNPTSEVLNVSVDDFNGGAIEIFSIDGRKVVETVLTSNNSVLDLQMLKAGNYIYRISDSNELPVAGGKFIKK